MKVILNRDILNLGEEGDICQVADGYARNYLLPQKLAVPFNNNNLARFDSKREGIEERKEEKRRTALGLKEKLESEELRFLMSAAESGKLFGSVTSSAISEELEKLGYEIDKRRIDIPDNHIRFTGEYTAKIKLYGQEEAKLKVTVEAEKK
jgi:large subunit ribosomal protein L9